MYASLSSKSSEDQSCYGSEREKSGFTSWDLPWMPSDKKDFICQLLLLYTIDPGAKLVILHDPILWLGRTHRVYQALLHSPGVHHCWPSSLLTQNSNFCGLSWNGIYIRMEHTSMTKIFEKSFEYIWLYAALIIRTWYWTLLYNWR